MLWRAAVAIGRSQGTGGATWTGVRVQGGDPATDSTTITLPSQTIYFVENNPVKTAQALPATSIYAAPFWGIAPLGQDIQAGDVFSNGTIAFLITGAPDVSQGYQRIPAALK